MENESEWLSVVRWVLGNPEKFALFLVVLAGAWRWLRELWHGDKIEHDRESFVDSLIRENRQLRDELRDERKRARRSGDNEDSGRNT